MAIILPHGLTSEEIRVLQEFRLRTTDTLTLDAIKGIKHPAASVGEKPAATLVSKGYLTAEGDGFTITPKGKDFLAIEAKPFVAGTSDAAASAVENPKADGV